MQRLARHLNRFLLFYAIAAMAVGIAIGHPFESWSKGNPRLLGDPTTAGVFPIIFPMVNVRFGALVKAGRNLKGLSLALAYNFIWAPLLTLLVATWLDRRLGLNYREHMAVVFAGTGKNNATVIAIATVAFSPLVAVPAATRPIFQVMLLVGYLKVAGWVRRYYAGIEPLAIPVLPLERIAVGSHAD